MKPKQLTNVLVKILGLSLIVRGISILFDAIVSWLQFAHDNHAPLFSDLVRNSHYYIIVLADLIPFAVGFALIVASRWLVEKLFKNEEE
jgi:hypothetical protein